MTVEQRPSARRAGTIEGEPAHSRFQSLTLPHLDRLLAFATRWGDGEEAEDYVQETYLSAWRAFDQLRDPGAVFPWLCKILRTVAMQQGRIRSRRRNLLVITELEAVHEELVASDAPSPLEQVLARLELGKLSEALRSLPEEFGEAVELSDVHGLKYREIARVTKAPIGTVMSRISRGRRLLAAVLLETRAAKEENGSRRTEGE
jgi:RNA polymerase sigma-70 factor, ECF subfamily